MIQLMRWNGLSWDPVSGSSIQSLLDLLDVPDQVFASKVLARNSTNSGFEWIDLPSTTAGHEINALPQMPKLSFVGSGVQSVANDVDTTIVTITGGTGGGVGTVAHLADIADIPVPVAGKLLARTSAGDGYEWKVPVTDGYSPPANPSVGDLWMDAGSEATQVTAKKESDFLLVQVFS